MEIETVTRSQQLADTVPFYGEGEPIPKNRDMSAGDDTSGFSVVIRILARSWPYLCPQVLGRWWQPDTGVEDGVAELVGERGYSFVYMPVLVTLLTLIAPYLGFVPVSFIYPFNLLFALIAVIVFCAWVLPFFSGRLQGGSLVVLLIAVLLANLVSVVLVEESAYSIHGCTHADVFYGLGRTDWIRSRKPQVPRKSQYPPDLLRSPASDSGAWLYVSRAASG